MTYQTEYGLRARFQGLGAGANNGPGGNSPSDISGIPLPSGTPTDGQTLVYSAANNAWIYGTVAPPFANPTATASNVAVNGIATTAMRSDAAPAVQLATSSIFGLVKPDGTIITVSGGAITVPTATSSVLGVVKPDGTIITNTAGAITVAKASSSVFGVVEVDNTTITASSGVISTPGGHNPTATAADTAVNGSATTFMRSDGAPAIQKASASQFGIVELDGTTVTLTGGGKLQAFNGGVSGNNYSWTQCSSGFVNSAQAFATQGAILLPIATFTADVIYAGLGSAATAGHVYTIAVCTINSSNVVQTVVGTANLTAAGGQQLLSFTGQGTLTFTSGTRYSITLTDTNAASTTTTNAMQGATSGVFPVWSAVPLDGSTLNSTSQRAVLAKLSAPGIGDTFTLNSGTSLLGLRAQF